MSKKTKFRKAASTSLAAIAESVMNEPTDVQKDEELEKDTTSEVETPVKQKNENATEDNEAPETVKEDEAPEVEDETEGTEPDGDEAPTAEVSPKQKMTDDVMKKVATMDEEDLTALHGQIIKQTGPAEVENGLDDVAKGVAAAPKATAPKANGAAKPGTLTEEEPEVPKTKTAKEVDEDDETHAEPDGDEEKEVVKEDADADADDETVKEDADADKDDETVTEAEVETDADGKPVSTVKEDADEDEDDDEVVNADEDVDALVKGEDGLTEGFKTKAKTIFEAAVKSKVRAARKSIHESAEAKVKVEVAKVTKKLTEQVDSYLTYVTESWMKENKVAIDASLRTEIAESFISSLKNVFAESYIEIPAAKKDLVESLNNQVVTLTEQVKKQAITISTHKKQNATLLRKSIVEQCSKGLPITQVAKLNELTKDVHFESPEAFQKKVITIRESYFGKRPASQPAKRSTIVEQNDTTAQVRPGTEVIVEGQTDPNENLSPDMKRYVTALSRGRG